MLPNSFRLKIALLSGAITGGLLIATSALLWQMTYQTNLRRVDRELRNLGRAQLDRVNGGDHWVRFESALEVTGGQSRGAFILWVKHENRVVHASPHWPKSIAADKLPVPTTYEPPFKLQPGDPLPPPPRREPITPDNPALPRKEPIFVSRADNGKTWRIAMMGNPYMTLAIGADLDEVMSGMSHLRNTYLAALPVALLLVAAGSWLLASRALQPISLLTRTVEQITAKGLDQRIPLGSYDREMTRLVTVFNEMLDRLERSFHQAVRFSADAAHELKTPLTVLQTELEDAVHRSSPGSDEQRVYCGMLEEIRRLKSITQKLLLLAKADAGQLRLELRPFNLTAALQDVIEDTSILANGIKVSSALEPEVLVQADPELLHQVLQNLSSNAAKYNHPDGEIRFELSANEKLVTLRIGNTGPGIEPASRERIFERFFRGDPSRSRAIEGAGLGLSLSREIARAHHGELILEPAIEKWTWFRLTLKRCDASIA